MYPHLNYSLARDINVTRFAMKAYNGDLTTDHLSGKEKDPRKSLQSGELEDDRSRKTIKMEAQCDPLK